MTDEFQWIWKEAAVAKYRYDAVISWKDWGKQRELSGRVAGVPAEIRTKNLPDTNTNSFLWTILLGMVRSQHGHGSAVLGVNKQEINF
jgi:hypothetical protein